MEVQAQFASEQRQALVLQSPKANVVLANAEIMLDAAKLDRENLRNPTPAMIEVAEKRINEAQERYDDALKAITLLEDKIEKRDKESMDFLLQSVKEIVILPKDEERQIDWDKVDTDLIQEIRSFFRTGKRV